MLKLTDLNLFDSFKPHDAQFLKYAFADGILLIAHFEPINAQETTPSFWGFLIQVKFLTLKICCF